MIIFQIFHSMTYIKIFIMLHLSLSFGHNYAIIMPKKGVKHHATYFITKNGYSDLVVMSSELYDKFARTNRIDQSIFESEQEISNGAEAVDAEIVFAELEKKHFG